MFGHEAINEGAGDDLGLGEFGDGDIAEIGKAERVEDDDDSLGVLGIEGFFGEAEGGCAPWEDRVAAEVAVGFGGDGSGVGFCFSGDDFEQV